MGVTALQEIARRFAGRPRLWRDDVDRDHRERAYVELFTTERLDVQAISRMSAGDDTGSHDRPHRRGGVGILDGGAWSRRSGRTR
ncbi:hypothetical protein E4P41_15430 [Geodermatophilus sp. DF01-2]|uniref:hypothetical protein n=1 Tax=Geodermatophilus sp. DF01-2 TaxID=2559610 RepID=UPI00107471BE|nr:hypothetical protein [Geodermatophilus sp. DF01_2]TFV56649.1 hypothetical protein E4P41_15430 [Geodermatophilus sp. DF01_2]